jgi:hypothetical protein
MDGCAVRSARHETVEDVELAHEMALPDATDRRIARHLPGIFGAEGKQANPRTAAGRGGRSFASGVTGADHQDIKHEGALS